MDKLIRKVRGKLSNPIVRRLLKYRKCELDTWCYNVVKWLVKTLHSRPNVLKSFEKSLMYPNVSSDCVLIHRNMEGRFNLGAHRLHPHVIYCRVFRWPDITSQMELRSHPQCKHPFHSKSSQVCVNPFHYHRVSSCTPNLQPVLVPRYSANPATSTHLHTSSSRNVMNNQLRNYHAQNVNLSQHSYISHSMHESKPMKIMQTMQQMQKTPKRESPESLPGYFPNAPNVDNWHESFTHSSEDDLMHLDNKNDINSLWENQNQQNDFCPLMETPSPSGSETQEMDNQLMVDSDVMQTMHKKVDFQEPEAWCAIAYFEYNNRLGKEYHGKTSQVIVDCLQDSVAYCDRFCLSTISNESRQMLVQHVQFNIGAGLGLTYSDGQIILECLSKNAVFVQSCCSCMMNNFNLNTVFKVPPGCNMVIFSFYYFAQLLRDAVNQGVEAVHGLHRNCCIRVSFIKGWGEEYSRKDITATPCWIEIRLNGALHWLDKVLAQMGPSTNPISSFS